MSRLSDCIDPADINNRDSTVRSPSGNLLAIGKYLQRDDRPLSIRERQQKIKARLAEDVTRIAEGDPGESGTKVHRSKVDQRESGGWLKGICCGCCGKK